VRSRSRGWWCTCCWGSASAPSSAPCSWAGPTCGGRERWSPARPALGPATAGRTPPKVSAGATGRGWGARGGRSPRYHWEGQKAEPVHNRGRVQRRTIRNAVWSEPGRGEGLDPCAPTLHRNPVLSRSLAKAQTWLPTAGAGAAPSASSSPVSIERPTGSRGVGRRRRSCEKPTLFRTRPKESQGFHDNCSNRGCFGVNRCLARTMVTWAACFFRQANDAAVC